MRVYSELVSRQPAAFDAMDFLKGGAEAGHDRIARGPLGKDRS
jgi:hypothetical protein